MASLEDQLWELHRPHRPPLTPCPGQHSQVWSQPSVGGISWVCGDPIPPGSQAGPVRRWATMWEGWELPVSAGCSGRVWLKNLGPREGSRYSKVPRHDPGANDRRTSLSPSLPRYKVSYLSAGWRGSLSLPLCSPVFTCSSWSPLYKIPLFPSKDCAIRKNNSFPYFSVSSVPNTQQVSTNLSDYYYCYCSYFLANLLSKF